MNKFKKICMYLVCLAASLCLMSCWHSSADDYSASQNSNTESTKVLFTGIIKTDSSLPQNILSSNKTDRAASPAAIDMTTHEFYVIAKSKAGATLEAEVTENPDTGLISFEMPLDFGEWTIETGIIKTSNQQKILVDTFTTTLLTNTPTFSHAFYLKPVNEGLGSINLEMYVPDSITKMLITVHGQPEGADFDTTECTADGEAPDRKIILTRTEVPTGTYNLIFTYYNSANNPQFSTIQTINVLAGLETSKWVSGSTSILIGGGFFAVTDDLIEAWRNQRSHYYVDSTNGSDSNAGGPLDPFETLSHAVSIINDIYGSETKEVKIDLVDGFEETLVSASGPSGPSGTLGISQNKTITIHANDNGTAKLHRGTGFYGEFISIPVSSTLILEGLIIDGGGIPGDKNQGVDNAGTFIMNSGKICGNNNTEDSGGGVYNTGDFYLNGGEISGNVSNGSGAGIYLNGTDITISGGIVKNNYLTDNSPSNLFLQSGKKIKVEKAIASGTDISVSFGWVPKKVNADTAIFTEGYGTKNSTKDPANVFKSDDKYYVIPLTSSSLVEAGIALSGKSFENVFSSYKMTFAMHDNFNKFMPSDLTAANRTIQIDPTVMFNSEEITETVSESIKWKLSLYYRGGLVGEVNSNVMVIPEGAGYTGRYDLHVYAEYLGLHKDTEFVITGYNNIINVNSENIQTVFNQLTSGELNISKDTCINLQNSLDFSNTEYLPIGVTIEGGKKTYKNTDFEGVFDGNGNTIKVGYVKSPDFYTVCYHNKGTIQNVIIECTKDITLLENYSEESGNIYNADNEPGKYRRYGGVCSLNDGTIRNCWTKANVKGKFFGYIGGICGVNGGLIENCVNTGSFTDMTWGFSYSWGGQYGEAGGITGRNSTKGVVRNCVNYGTVELKNKVDNSSCLNGSAGAICGVCTHGTSEIKNCYWRENCVNTGTSSSPSLKNWVVFQPAHYGKSSVTNGSFEGNGFFTSNNSTELTAGPDVVGYIKTWTQTLQYGSNLLDALNAYVNTVDPNHSYLKEWEAGNNYAAILKQ